MRRIIVRRDLTLPMPIIRAEVVSCEGFRHGATLPAHEFAEMLSCETPEESPFAPGDAFMLYGQALGGKEVCAGVYCVDYKVWRGWPQPDGSWAVSVLPIYNVIDRSVKRYYLNASLALRPIYGERAEDSDIVSRLAWAALEEDVWEGNKRIIINNAINAKHVKRYPLVEDPFQTPKPPKYGERLI